MHAGEDYTPQPPIRYVGCVQGTGGMKTDWRYIDANNRSISSLELYRFLMALDAEDDWEGTRADAIRADLERQYEADPDLGKVADFLGRVEWRPVWEMEEER